jgi:serine protease AprX
MRQNRANSCGDRSNALWGRGSRGEARSNALWGRGGRRAGATVLMAMAAFSVMAAVSVASPGGKAPATGNHSGLKAYVEDSLLAAIQQDPKQKFDVILQGAPGQKSSGFVTKVLGDSSGSSDEHLSKSDVRRQFNSIDGFQGTLTGKVILHLAKQGLVSSVLANETVEKTAVQLPLYSTQLWPWVTGAPVDWTNGSPKAPTIAIVDSGIDPAHTADFGNRVLGQVNLASLTPNSPGDGYGHGTFVAGIAAGAAPGFAGAAPKANLVSLDVMNDQGQATVGDVINACDWILANKSTYNIQVANFSLHAMNRASVMFDPLDAAVEKLWLNGVVVVAAAGNYATDAQNTPSGVPFAPGNDPFVITVGAADIGTQLGLGDDNVAPWSAWGYTGDGFMKPDISAPGRYMVGPVTAGGGLALERPDKVIKPGYMQLSGTSFSAPIVAAAAAMLRQQNPTWTPDQVKGALMVTALPTPLAKKGSLGVGEVNIALARMYKKTPPNPNAGLDQYLTKLSDGSSVFNAAAWQSAAWSSAAWNSAAWNSAAWSDAAWSSAAWSDAAWSDAAWSSAAWSTAAWSDAAWSDAAWSDAAWSDFAETETAGDVADADAVDQAAAEADLGIVDPNCDPTLTICQAVTDTTTAVTTTTSTTTSTVGGLLP